MSRQDNEPEPEHRISKNLSSAFLKCCWKLRAGQLVFNKSLFRNGVLESRNSELYQRIAACASGPNDSMIFLFIFKGLFRYATNLPRSRRAPRVGPPDLCIYFIFLITDFTYLTVTMTFI